MNKKKSTNQFNTSEDVQVRLQSIRDQVLVDELKARHWKAQYETAYYHMEFDKLLPDYTAFLEKLQKEREEAEQKQKEYMDQIKKEAAELKSGFNVEELIEKAASEVQEGI